MSKNIILSADSYKQTHYLQTPASMSNMSAYIEARDNKISPYVIFFGLQAYIQEYLLTPVTLGDVAEAEIICEAHGVPFNKVGWLKVINDHDGYLPITIEALPEGAKVPSGVPLVQVKAATDGFGWLVTFIETALLRAIWYPTTVATISHACRTVIYQALQESSDDPDGQLPFKLHDFGARGVSSGESAGIGGAAHLINFMGTDTMEGLMWARMHYGATMPGFSIPAAEHSTMTSWGQTGETNAYRNMIKQFGRPGKLLAVVSDSYDLDNAVDQIWCKDIKDEVLASGATVVIRPDSGDPVTTPLRVIKKLWEAYGGTTNSKGFKVLNPAVRVIQGDGLDPTTIAILCAEVLNAGFSLDNIAFGMGGGLLQKVDRDTFRFAMKANAIQKMGGGWVGINKDPSTDPTKASKKGRQAVDRNPTTGEYFATDAHLVPDHENHLVVVYESGELFVEHSFEDIRKRANPPK